MDELLSLFNADDSADDNDTSHQETQPATQTRKTKLYQGAPSSINDFGSSFANAFATSNSTTKRNINEENVQNKSRVAKQYHTYTATTKSTTNIQKHKSNNTTCSDPYTNFVITDRRTSRANMV